MSKLDPNRLFSIFESNNPEEYEENNVSKTLESPYVILGMVIKGVENFEVFDSGLRKEHGASYQKVAGGIQTAYFDRLYSFLCRVSEEDLDELHGYGDLYSVKSLVTSLTKLLKFYEVKEDYLKCAKIKKLLDIFL